jgi:hypothetical protein
MENLQKEYEQLVKIEKEFIERIQSLGYRIRENKIEEIPEFPIIYMDNYFFKEDEKYCSFVYDLKAEFSHPGVERYNNKYIMYFAKDHPGSIFQWNERVKEYQQWNRSRYWNR